MVCMLLEVSGYAAFGNILMGAICEFLVGKVMNVFLAIRNVGFTYGNVDFKIEIYICTLIFTIDKSIF